MLKRIMEQLTRKMLDTLARLGNSEHITLIRVENTSTGILIAGLNKEKFIFLDKNIEFKGSPLEGIITSRQFQTFPATFTETVIFPVYDKTNNLDCLCLPLLNERFRVIGIAILSQKTNVNLSHERLQTLNIIASLLAVTLEENGRLEQLATTDQLTKLYTRNYFEKRLREEFTRVRRHGGVISLLLLEIDNFKQINDTCGYQQGTKVLQETAELLSNSVRHEIDIACRHGSKHFIVLLPNTEVDGAYVLAERIRQRCEKRKFTTLQGIPIKVTMSIGISHNVDIPHGEELDENDLRISEVSKEELIHRADLMLHAAKQAGHNQVMVWW
jgi:diguanylate cyclase (GGDEF)-like protein